MVPSSTCDEDRVNLNLRLDWFWHGDVEGIDVRRNLTKCPDVRDSMVMAELSWLPKRLNHYRTAFRFNTSNHTYMRNDWRFHYLRTMRHVSAAEKILENLLLKSSLFDFFHPARFGTAVFFYAASLMRSLLTILPLMVDKQFQALSLSQRPSDSFWRRLEAGLLRDVALDVALPDTPPPCTLLAALQDLLVADGLRIEAGSDWSGALGQEIRRSLDSAQQQLVCTKENHGGRLLQHFMFPKAFVFFHFLDRLDCRKVAAIKAHLLGESFLRSNKTFWMHVLPARHIESNHVRGKGDFHCGCNRLIGEQLEQSKGENFRFVEVGASLGGCTWRVLTSNDRAIALAVEPYKPAADAMRRTALENGLADRFTISESFVSTNYTCPGVLRVGFAHEFVDQDELKQVDASHVVQHDCQTATLADILNKWSNATVDLLRIHVDGLEMDVLRSAAENLHKIQTLAISMWTYRDFPQAYDPVAIIQLLLDSGCTTTLYYLFVRPRKRTRPEMKELHNQEAVSALTKSQVMTLDTMTLMAFCGEK